MWIRATIVSSPIRRPRTAHGCGPTPAQVHPGMISRATVRATSKFPTSFGEIQAVREDRCDMFLKHCGDPGFQSGDQFGRQFNFADFCVDTWHSVFLSTVKQV